MKYLRIVNTSMGLFLYSTKLPKIIAFISYGNSPRNSRFNESSSNSKSIVNIFLCIIETLG